MLHVALWEPEIPPNTGNIARLCAATGSPLHLIGRVRFRLDDRSLRRAGVDCWEHVEVVRHLSIQDFETWRAERGHDPSRCFALSAHAKKPYTEARFQDGDAILFGCESYGLLPETLARFEGRLLTVPMPTGKTRSLNLATVAGIVLYEALRQLHSR
jgi:tRNA (cytidine/uridine-2'-O-)-methyltransferase